MYTKSCEGEQINYWGECVLWGFFLVFLQIIHTDLSFPFQQTFQTEDQVEILLNTSDLSWI